ncbi:TetR/AcrR family transcriptional regulator [Microbacterium rhizomatis]|uniref:TetR/AcrR family transcriptional regulator n=1 Tax=Microbacterium rhizomatis TaxID=1631477 RepID=A0A5J5J432_9MICO|nr:TetR/AcrR family transcriptional regulator [Microbacterium rhizomatis]KAA9108093.1 TetR/AcrR family transcriptional regulator [Microbacterium rhizomatis]
MPTPEEPAPAQPSNPALHARVTSSITRAFFEEMAESGYGQTSVDAIVRRAGVGKAALYRRWPTKKAMAIALISDAAVRSEPAPDTGSLHGDISSLVHRLSAVLGDPLVGRVVLAVTAESSRDPELENVLRESVEGPRRANLSAMLLRAIDRGELRADCDIDLALDLIAGALYWRVLVRRQGWDAGQLDRLSAALTKAITAI